jgi:hypothetical protein
MERALLFIGILCLVSLTLLLIIWDGKPRKEPIAPTVPKSAMKCDGEG